MWQGNMCSVWGFRQGRRWRSSGEAEAVWRSLGEDDEKSCRSSPRDAGLVDWGFEAWDPTVPGRGHRGVEAALRATAAMAAAVAAEEGEASRTDGLESTS